METNKIETKNWFAGILSGLVVGGILDLLLGSYFMWAIMVIFGFETGYIFDLRERLKQLNLENPR